MKKGVSIVALIIIVVLVIFSSFNKTDNLDLVTIEKSEKQDQIKIIQENKKTLENLIIKNKEQFANDYPNLFNNFLAVSIGDNPKLIQPNGGENISTYKDFDSDYGFWYYSQFYFTNRSEGIIVYNDKLNSGAYNLTNYLYFFTFKDNGVLIDFFRILDIDESTLQIKEIEPKDLEVQNAFYDNESKMVTITGMRPFGLYPCNEVRYFRIVDNKLILQKIEIAKACKEKGIEFFNYPLNGEALGSHEEFDFSPVIIFETPEKTFQEALKI